MVSEAKPAPHVSLQNPAMDKVWGIRRSDLDLTKDRLSGVFGIYNGPVVLVAAFMEITTAASANVCNMSWVFDGDVGGSDKTIGADVSITSAAIGDFIWAELDGTALVKATTGSGLIHNGYYRGGSNGYGTILTQGEIDIVLGSNALTTGVGRMTVVYEPLVPGAIIAPEDMIET